MKSIGEKFDTRIETSDWRYSAAIVGILRYFDFVKVELSEDVDYLMEDDYIEFDKSSITKEKYLKFAEFFFEDEMHHVQIEKLLNCEKTDNVIKNINTYLGKVEQLKEIKYNDNDDEIKKIIDENRLKMIEKLLVYVTKNKPNCCYGNYLNTYKKLEFLSEPEKKQTGRIINYNVDKSRKTNSLGFNWNATNFIVNDIFEFDFIPFAFTKNSSKNRDSLFINNNVKISNLLKTNNFLLNSDEPKSFLFEQMQKSGEFISFNVEVIVKTQGTKYFETMYIRQASIDIIQSIKNYRAIKFWYKVNENYYINMEEEAIKCILNLSHLDRYIEILIKDQVKNDDSGLRYVYNIKTLININTKIYGGVDMTNDMKNAYFCGKKVAEKIDDNKVKSYKQKLISALIFHDYDRFCDILVNLASYTEIAFDFGYKLFENFEENKNLAYTFINSLNKGVEKDD